MDPTLHQTYSSRGRRFLSLAFAAIMCVTAATAQTVRETVLRSFTARTDDGGNPKAGLLWAGDGWLYGTTWGGGERLSGTIFKMQPDGSGFALIHQFGAEVVDADGTNPRAGLIQASDGLLYGTTYSGGKFAAGTVYRLDTNGQNYSVIYDFTNGADGGSLLGGVIQGTDGALYGTSWTGGGPKRGGTVYRLSLEGPGFSVLHAFANTPDGSAPECDLLQASDGVLYGTTWGGGDPGAGTVFRVQTDGSEYKVLHNFDAAQAESPRAGLVQGTDGRLYGTTINPGGEVFALSTNGDGFIVLHSFGFGADGVFLYAPLLLGADHALYGAAVGGGVSDRGTVFRLNQDGSAFTVLHHFAGGPLDGDGPDTRLTGTGSVLFGTTRSGGAYGFGTIYRLDLVPTIAICPTNGAAQITVTGFPGQSCHLHATTNLCPGTWTSIAALTLTNGTAQFLDKSLTSTTARFYRACAP